MQERYQRQWQSLTTRKTQPHNSLPRQVRRDHRVGFCSHFRQAYASCGEYDQSECWHRSRQSTSGNQSRNEYHNYLSDLRL